MKDQKFLGAALVAVAIVVAGFALRSGIITFKDRDRVVCVKGLAEREVKADKVTWSLVYKEMGDDPTEMYETLERKNAAIVAFLKAGGVTDEEISVNPPAVTDRQANDYADPGQISRYKATGVVTVTSKDVDKVRQLLSHQGELMKQGIPLIDDSYGDNNITYEFTGLNEIKPSMIEEATKNARKTAEKFAADSKSELGKIANAYQGQFEINDRDATTPYIKEVRVVVTMDYRHDD